MLPANAELKPPPCGEVQQHNFHEQSLGQKTPGGEGMQPGGASVREWECRMGSCTGRWLYTHCGEHQRECGTAVSAGFREQLIFVAARTASCCVILAAHFSLLCCSFSISTEGGEKPTLMGLHLTFYKYDGQE